MAKKTPKIPKIHAMRLKGQVDIQVDPGSGKSLEDARGIKASIEAHVKKLGYTLVIVDYRLTRVPAPEPAPAPEPETTGPVDDGMALPDNLRRTAPETAAAE